MGERDRAPSTEVELEERLSRPNERALDALAGCPGDVIVLGAGGKMGPSLCRMLQRAVDQLGDERRIIAVSRFGGVEQPSLALEGIPGSERIVAISRDLTSPLQVELLPDVPNVIFMAGQKFGTSGDPSATWVMNAAVPTLVANRFAASRTVVFSTGNVYPLVNPDSGGSGEVDPPAPVGEYAASCLARERIFTYYCARHQSSALLFRLNYATDLRYGVLVDIAQRLLRGETISLEMGYFNTIWQGDANAFAIAALAHCKTPPAILNITGSALLRVREVAQRLGALLQRTPVFSGVEMDDALLSNNRRMRELLGDPAVNEDELINWVASWVHAGGRLLSKPTHFEERGGNF